MIYQPSSEFYQLSQILYPAPVLHKFPEKVLSGIRMKETPECMQDRKTHKTGKQNLALTKAGVFLLFIYHFEALESHFHLDGGNKILANFDGSPDKAEDSTPAPIQPLLQTFKFNQGRNCSWSEAKRIYLCNTTIKM